MMNLVEVHNAAELEIALKSGRHHRHQQRDLNTSRLT